MSIPARLVSSGFLKKLSQTLLLGNVAARVLANPVTDADSLAEPKDAQGQLVACLDSLRTLRRTSGTREQFEQHMVDDLGCTTPQVRIAEAALGQQDEYVKKTLGCMAGAQTWTTAELSGLLDEYLSSDTARRDLSRRTTVNLEQDDPGHPLYPFFEALKSPDLSVAVRAEVLAQLDVYVRSGHAECDFLGKPVDGRILSPEEQESVEALRQWMSDVRTGTVPADGAALTQVFMQRLAYLYMPTEIVSRRLAGGESLPVARRSSRLTALLSVEGKGQVAGSRMVDGVIRDARDHHRLHVVFATSKLDTRSQKDQIARQCSAIHRAVLAIPVHAVHPTDGFLPGDAIDTVHFYSPALVGVEESQSQRQIERLAACLGPDHREALNALPLLSLLSADMDGEHSSTDFLLRTRHRIIGGNSAFAKAASSGAIEDLAEDAARVLKKAIQGLHEMVRQNPAKPLLALDDVSLLCEMVSRTAAGLYANYPAACAQVLTERDYRTPLEESLQAFQEARLQGPRLSLRSTLTFLSEAAVEADHHHLEQLSRTRHLALNLEDKLRQTRNSAGIARRNRLLAEAYISQVGPDAPDGGNAGLYAQADLYLALARWCSPALIKVLDPALGLEPRHVIEHQIEDEHGQSVPLFEASEQIQKEIALAFQSRQTSDVPGLPGRKSSGGR